VQFAPRQDDDSAKLDVGRGLRNDADAALAAEKKPAGSCEPAGWKPSNPSPDQGQKKRGREYPTTFP
jgi:hypothetical protein